MQEWTKDKCNCVNHWFEWNQDFCTFAATGMQDVHFDVNAEKDAWKVKAFPLSKTSYKKNPLALLLCNIEV